MAIEAPENQGESAAHADAVERRGVGPWVGERPVGDHFDAELLRDGDYRNVEDEYRYWTREAIQDAIHQKSFEYEVAIENLGHDFNIGSIVRTANALGARAVHIVGRRRWNRRGAMVTDRYLQIDHFPTVEGLVADADSRGRVLIGIDNLPGSTPLEEAELPRNSILIFGEEAAGLSPQMRDECAHIHHITQYGSTRSMNVGHAAAISMWAWVTQHRH